MKKILSFLSLLMLCIVGVSAQEVQTTYTVVGNSAAIFGEMWSPTLEANDMVKGDDGIYTKTYKGVELTQGFTLAYKVVKDHAWTENWGNPSGNDGNAEFTVWEGDGTYNVTFKFNPDGTFDDGTHVFCSMTKKTEEPEPIVINAMAVVGTFPGMSWDADKGIAMANTESEPAIWSVTMEGVTVEGIKYEYKAAANGNWDEYVLPNGDNAEFIFGTEEYPAGTYNLTFTADTENHTITLDVQKAEYVLGDCSGNGEVTVSDAVMAVDFALGKNEPTEAQFKAADVNNSNDITVSDAVGIVNIALQITDNSGNGARMDNSDNFLVLSGKTVNLTNATSFAGFQMDVTLAEGAQFNGVQLAARAAGLKVDYRCVGENTWRIIALSLENSTISGNEGALLTLDIKGNSTIDVTNIEFADAAARAYVLGFNGEATGIDCVNNFNATGVDIYDVNGIRNNTLHKGMNIVRNANGEVKKVFVK